MSGSELFVRLVLLAGALTLLAFVSAGVFPWIAVRVPVLLPGPL